MTDGWIEINLPFDEDEAPESFVDRGLNKPGVLIEMQNGKKYLIGDINQARGECGCCYAFYYDAIVARYKIVWSGDENLQ